MPLVPVLDNRLVFDCAPGKSFLRSHFCVSAPRKAFFVSVGPLFSWASEQVSSTVCFSVGLRRGSRSGVFSRVSERGLPTGLSSFGLRKGSRSDVFCGVFPRVSERGLSTGLSSVRLRKGSRSGVWVWGWSPASHSDPASVACTRARGALQISGC